MSVGHAPWKVAPHAMYIAPALQAESAAALVHVLAQPAAFTLSTFQPARFWSNAVARVNMLCMFDTDAVFHAPMFWSKADADEKVCEKTAHFALQEGRLHSLHYDP